MIISGLINFTLGIALESSRKKAPPLYDVRLDDLPFFQVVFTLRSNVVFV